MRRKNKKNEIPVPAMHEVQTLALDELGKRVFVGASSVIGRRKEQQDTIVSDTFYAYDECGKLIAVLCDGMGGLKGGKRASSLCASTVHNAFHAEADSPSFSVPDFYRRAIQHANEGVRALSGDVKTPMAGSGTTMVSVVIDDDRLYWASVGDSRIYVMRGEEILCVTKDHNFMMLLQEQVKRGEITQAEADSNPKKEALVSYIGMDRVKYIDMNSKPVKLMDGDFILLCSDGLYRSVSPHEIKDVIRQYGADTQLTAETLTALAMSKNYKHQDNTSVIIIGFQDSG